MFNRVELSAVALCLLLTGTLYIFSSTQNAKVANKEFQAQTDEHVGNLRTRASLYLQSIKGVAALINTSDYVSANDFQTYVSSLDITEQLPGLSGIALAVEVHEADLDDFVSGMRARHHAEFSLRKLSEGPVHYIIKYIHPIESNEAALGLDITYSNDLKALLEEARATNSPMLSPPIILAQEDARKAPGFVLYLPVFKTNANEQHLGEFLGWVDAPFVAQNLFADLSSIQGKNYHVKVVDLAAPNSSTMLFDSSRGNAEFGRYASTRQIEIFGRTWVLTYQSTPHFDRAFLAFQPYLVLMAGLILTILLLLYLRSKRLRTQALTEIASLRFRQIAAQEEENRSIVENAFTPVFILNQADTVVFANQAALNCFGYAAHEIEGLPFSAIVTRNTEPGSNHNALGRTSSGQMLELDVQRNSWETHDAGTRTTAIIHDLTEQNNVQRELERGHMLVDLALSGARIGVFDIDLRTGKSLVSPTWCDIMEYDSDREEMDTQSFFMSRIHPDDIATVKSADADCIEGRTARSIAEYRIKSADNTWRWMRSDAGCVERDENGKAVRLIGTQLDITRLRQDKNALETSERRFRQVLAHAPIGMALLDMHGNFIGVNDAFCDMAGMTEDELLTHGKLPDLMPYEDRKTLYSSISGLMQTGMSTVYAGEHRILHSRGRERWGLLNVSWSQDENDGSHFFIAQIIDITDQKRLELVKSEFVSTVSHELRTPLTSIKGALGLLKSVKNTNLTAVEKNLVGIANSNADRLVNIVNDILDLEKMSSGEMSFSLKSTDLSEVIRTAAIEMSPFAIDHKNELTTDLPEEPLHIHADQGRMNQLLVNLVSNACKYSDPDSEVVIKAEKINDKAVVYIQNVGPGVPENFRPYIFDAFSQGDSSDTRAKGGTGLGLNISRQIVSRHHGQIGFESTPGGVTVFWFAIPISAASQRVAPGRRSAAVPVSDPPRRAQDTESDQALSAVV